MSETSLYCLRCPDCNRILHWSLSENSRQVYLSCSRCNKEFRNDKINEIAASISKREFTRGYRSSLGLLDKRG